MAKARTKAQEERQGRIIELGCVIRYLKNKTPCMGRPTIQHCGTYMGGGRDHDEVICLCWEHHLGAEGIDGKRMGKRVWEAKYATEEELKEITKRLLGETSEEHAL